MERISLFRSEALAAHRLREPGRIVIAGPVALRVLSAFVVAVALTLTVFSYVGTYTAHRTLRGRLVTERGAVDIRSPQAGIVVECRVQEGQVVGRGDVLYVVSSERTSSVGATQQSVGEQLDRRKRAVVEQMGNARSLARMESESIDQSIAAIASEALELDEAVESQRSRVELARELLDRYERIRAMGFVSEEHVLAKRADLLDQRSRLDALERDGSNVARQLADLDGRRAMTSTRYDNQLSELEGALAETDLQIVENEARRAIVIAATDDGTVTGLAAVVGDRVDAVAPLAVLVPLGSDLRAELYAPSRAAGFLATGQEVLLRYEAYPYQKFGHYRGRVTAVSQTALAADALRAAQRSTVATSEPLYQVIVALQQQTVNAYGEPTALRPGMGVEADVMLETRRLYEWVFEPLYSLAGRSR